MRSSPRSVTVRASVAGPAVRRWTAIAGWSVYACPAPDADGDLYRIESSVAPAIATAGQHPGARPGAPRDGRGQPHPAGGARSTPWGPTPWGLLLGGLRLGGSGPCRRRGRGESVDDLGEQ